MKKRIVLVSSGQPSANPRLVKEATALSDAGYGTTVIYCPLSPWADESDKRLMKQYPDIEWIVAGVHPNHQPLRYKFARLRQKIYQYLFRFFPSNVGFAIRSNVLFSQELMHKAISKEADLYIGHNIGALSAVTTAARRFQRKASFDFEDYHRGEDKEGSVHWRKIKLIEDYYVPMLAGATAASPLIAEAYQQHYPSLSIVCINNCFPLRYQQAFRTLPSAPLKLFWFSQYIGPERGLETIIEAIGLTERKDIVFTLLGNVSEEHRGYFSKLAARAGLADSQLIFHPPVAEESLVSIAAEHHIGVAAEVSLLRNRDLCLTNKIFTYLLAGNAIVFSETRAQVSFQAAAPQAGILYHNASALSKILLDYISDPQRLHAHRHASYSLGRDELNWDQEQKKFLVLIKQILS